jgi:hypothetical protein
MHTKDLLTWSQDHRVVERAKNGFNTYLANWKKENPE